MLGLDELHEDFYDEIGGVDGTLAQLVESADITRYLNQGQRRLGWYVEKSTDLTWAAEATSVDFPSDYAVFGTIIINEGTRLPAHRIWSDGLHFLAENGAEEAGGARLLYHARPAAITDSQDSELTDEGDAAIVAYAAYRFFRKLAAGRADYRRYATLSGANGVDIEELQSMAERYYDEFVAAEQSIPAPAPVTFFGD